MNCLRYEHASYQRARKRYPREGQVLETSLGEEEVTGWNHLQGTVSLRGREGKKRTVDLDQLREETERARGS